MVKRDDNTSDPTPGSVRDTVAPPAEPIRRTPDSADEAELHQAHYRPEMGNIVPANDRLTQDGR